MVKRFETEGENARYISGLSVYCEHLIDGRFVTGMRSASGRPYYQGGEDSLGKNWASRFCGNYPIEAFSLEIDGMSLHGRWKWVSSNSFDEAEAVHSVIKLSNEICRVETEVHTKIDETGFFERWLEIKNLSDKPMALSRIEPMRGLLWHVNDRKEHAGRRAAGDEPFTLTTLPFVYWGYEGYTDTRAVSPGTVTFESFHGRSGWGVPWFSVKNNLSGETAVCHLEWSGNWEYSLTNLTPVEQNEIMLLFGIGPKARAPQRMIAAGETVVSPKVHLGLFYGGDFSAVNQTLKHVRNISRKADEKNLLIGAARIVDGELDWLENEVKLSAEAGMEYFMIDAGWYGNWNANWYNSTGDWNVTRFGNTLETAREIIQRHGMKFCLWMELETMGSGSELRKNHPEWALHRDGKPADGEGRILDMSRPEVFDFVLSETLNAFAEHKLDGFKVDYNTCCSEHGENFTEGYIENSSWRYVEALYKIFDRIAEEFPDAVLENCAGGGGRNDLGLFRRFHTSCISDYTVLPRGIKQVNNLSMALPPERLRYYYRHYPTYHSYGSFETQLNILMFCNPLFVGFGRDESWKNADEAAVVSKYVGLFKKFFRPVMIGCEVFHHTPSLSHDNTEKWCALEFSSPCRSKGYAGVFKFLAGRDEYIFKPAGISRQKKYRLTFLSTNESFASDGADLALRGLPIILDGALASEIIMYEETDEK